MSYPSMDLYNDAVQNPKTAFLDPLLSQGRVVTNGFGIPIALGGGFALTYTMMSGKRKFAVRCFHKQSTGLQDRYARISKALAGIGGSNFVGFEYQAQGVRVRGNVYPVVRMDWVEGETLGIWLENRYQDKVAVTKLVGAFRDLERFLRERGVAHGDLQNGNVLVVGNSLKLIDYDGLFVPSLPTGQGNEVGHKHFQHPKRQGSDFGPIMDRFSFIAIDLSLRALAEKPGLFAKHSNGDNILFSAGDYLDPAASQVFSDIRAIPSLSQDADNFAKICKAPINLVPSLEDFLAGRSIPATVVAFEKVGLRPNAGPTHYVGAHDVIDARDYAAALHRVGNRVELVGQIIEVKEAETRHGRPYVFVNFGPWNGHIVKLSIWSDGLKKLPLKPGQSWVNKWISVVGLLEPPYTNPKYNYSHISITIDEANQYRFIDPIEAQRRLASIGKPLPPSDGVTSNRAMLANISVSSPSGQKTAVGQRVKATAVPVKTANEKLLEGIRRTAAPAPASMSSGSWRPSRITPPPAQPPSSLPSPAKPEIKGRNVGRLTLIGGFIMLLMVLSWLL